MSVLECGRDCPEIMCDRYIPGMGYLCNDCWLELLAYKRTWSPNTEVWEVEGKIKTFFRMRKGVFEEKGHTEEVDEEFKRIAGEDG